MIGHACQYIVRITFALLCDLFPATARTPMMPAETENDRPAALARAAVSLSKGTVVLCMRVIIPLEER